MTVPLPQSTPHRGMQSTRQCRTSLSSGRQRRTSIWVSCLIGFVTTVVLLSVGTLAEKQRFNFVLPATPKKIHYTDFYLRAPPAVIDLSKLLFNVHEPHWGLDDNFETDDEVDDDAEELEYDDDDQEMDEEDWGDADDDDFNTRSLAATREMSDSTSIVDLIYFRLPRQCSRSPSGCDWTKLGVGVEHKELGELRWCCDDQAIEEGFCDTSGKGRMIIDESLFNGQRRFVEIPKTGDVTFHPNLGVVQEQVTGTYVIVMANCDESGQKVRVSGMASWKSSHGYLPGELYGFMYFFAVMCGLYLLLLLWFGQLMARNKDSRIPIEKWIIGAIALGLVEMVFRLSEVVVWNISGFQQVWLATLGIFVGVMKRGLSRCLMVMVSLGWGVTRDTLGRKLRWIIIAGVSYVAMAISRDVAVLVAQEDLRSLSQRAERDLFDVYKILSIFLAILDIIFIVWILDSLSTTMEYLQSMKQTRKLQRFVALRGLFLFAVLFASVWAVFGTVNTYATGILNEETAWIVTGAAEVNYLILLTGVAWMWRPNPAAKDYAYAMQLEGINGSGSTEIEMSGTVPSAMDDFDDDENHDGMSPPGFQSTLGRGRGSRNGKFNDAVYT